MRRDLPSEKEALEILARRRTRPAHRPAPKAGQALAKTIRALDDRFGKGAQALRARWPEIAGDAIASVSEPIRLIKGRAGQASTLELKVSGPAALLVQHQSDIIIEKVNVFLGNNEVGRLRISQGPLQARPGTGARARRPAPLSEPLDAATEAALAEGLEPLPTRLREALVRLGRGVLRSKRER